MRGSIVKKGKKYYIVVDIGTSYKRKQKWFSGFNSKKEAEKELPRILNDLNQGTYIEPSKQKYAEFIEQWLENKKSKISKNTYQTYYWNIKKHIKPSLGDFQLSKLNSLAIDNFYTELEEKGLSSATIRKNHTIIRSSLEYAKDYHFISRNPAAVVKPPAVRHKEINVWTEKEMLSFLRSIDKEKDSAIFYLALWTGMRKGEILGLKWEDIDLENKKIRVRRSFTRTGFSSTKTASSTRVIDVDDDVISKLKEQRKMVLENKMRCGEDFNDLDLVFCRADGNPLDVRNIGRRLDKLIKMHNEIIEKEKGELKEEHKLKRIRFHDLRHTHATIMLGMGVPAKIVQERLGHEKVEMTLNTYAHLLPSMQADAVKMFKEVMDNFKNISSEK